MRDASDFGRGRAYGCVRIALQLFVRCVYALKREVEVLKARIWMRKVGRLKARRWKRESKMAKVRKKVLRTGCVRGVGARRERLWSQPGGWLCEDCPPAVRAVRLRTGATASALGVSEAPPHVMRKRLGCATRATLVAAGRMAV